MSRNLRENAEECWGQTSERKQIFVALVFAQVSNVCFYLLFFLFCIASALSLKKEGERTHLAANGNV